jgi:hypothetical protein
MADDDFLMHLGGDRVWERTAGLPRTWKGPPNEGGPFVYVDQRSSSAAMVGVSSSRWVSSWIVAATSRNRDSCSRA